MRLFSSIGFAAFALSFSFTAARADEAAAPAKTSKLKGSMKQSAPKIDLGVPAFDSTPPKGTSLQKVTEPVTPAAPTASSETPYTVTAVTYAKSFTRSASGTKPNGALLTSVLASGSPLTTEKFASLIRVKTTTKRGSIIEVKVLDGRGDTVMIAEGQLAFQGSDEIDWTVDWDPTVIRAPGDFALHIRIASQAPVQFPLKVEAKEAKKPE